jgi:hypothetical protein
MVIATKDKIFAIIPLSFMLHVERSKTMAETTVSPSRDQKQEHRNYWRKMYKERRIKTPEDYAEFEIATERERKKEVQLEPID